MALRSDAGCSKSEVNLKVLLRYDAAVEEIIADAGHVELYEFNLDEKKWDRKHIQGSLFVVRRTYEPYFQLVILNKKSPTNFTEDLTPAFRFEVNLPYLIYRNALSEVIGIWFYEGSECQRIEACLTRVCSQLEEKDFEEEEEEEEEVASPVNARPSPEPLTTAPLTTAPTLLPPSYFKGGGATETPAIVKKYETHRSPGISVGRSENQPCVLGNAFAAMRLNEQPATEPPAMQSSSVMRDRVRITMQRLLANEQFLDMIASEFERSGST